MKNISFFSVLKWSKLKLSTTWGDKGNSNFAHFRVESEGMLLTIVQDGSKLELLGSNSVYIPHNPP